MLNEADLIEIVAYGVPFTDSSITVGTNTPEKLWKVEYLSSWRIAGTAPLPSLLSNVSLRTSPEVGSIHQSLRLNEDKLAFRDMEEVLQVAKWNN